MAFDQKSLNEIIYNIILNLTENVPDITDFNVGAILNTLIESISIEMKDLYEALNIVYDGTRIDTATGADLDQLGKLVGVLRRPGTKASGNVTFKRNTVSNTNFNVPAGAIISTAPNTGEDQLRFVVKNNTTFLGNITNEEHLFKDGIVNYPLNERFVGNIALAEIRGVVGTTSTIFVRGTDYNITKDFSGFVVNTDTVELIDDCDSAMDWNYNPDAAMPGTSPIRVQGDFSLSLGKTGTSSIHAIYDKLYSSTYDLRGKELVFDLYIIDPAVLLNVDRINVYFGNNSTLNSFRFTLNANNLKADAKFNKYRFNPTNSLTVTQGNPSISAINYIRLEILTKTPTNTLNPGDILLDNIIGCNTINYIGDVVEWVTLFSGDERPDNDTNFEVDYSPLSKEVLCEAEKIGQAYNVSANKINYKVTNISNINVINNYSPQSGGSDLESDDAYKSRVLFATELKGRGTIEAIRQAVLSVPGVRSVNVDDLPLRSTTGEVHFYSTGTSKYKLDNEVLYINDLSAPTNIQVSAIVSGSPQTLVYGADYVGVFTPTGAVTSEIEFQPLGDNPDNGTVFNVDYSYNWLGHVDVYITGVENPIPATVLEDIENTIEEYKAAGIQVHITTPTPTGVTIEAAITVDSAFGFTFSSVQPAVIDAIERYFEKLNIGDDIFIAKLYDVIMSVEGVLNANVITPITDINIAPDEIARIDVITITQL